MESRITSKGGVEERGQMMFCFLLNEKSKYVEVILCAGLN